jgi:hypothetical protein
MSKEVSQVFGGIGDAVSGVLKGVGDAVDGAVKGVGTLAKQIYESDIGKAIIIAGAVYFGGAALAGGFGSYGAGGSFLSGMGTGVASAADSIALAWEASSLGPLGNAWGAAGDAGANAARTLAGSGLTTTAAAPAMTSAAAPPVAPAAPPPVAPPPVATAGLPAGSPINSAAANLYTPVAQTAGQTVATDPSMFSQAMNYITPKSELAQYGLISGATTIGGNIIAGIGQQQALDDQREYEKQQLQAAQDLRNANVGAELFAPGQYATAPGPAPMPAGLARRYMPQVAPGSPGYVPGSQFAQAYNRLPPGMGLGEYVMRG